MNTGIKHTLGPWQVDACPDAHGFATVRRELAGSPHGDTDNQPIATVYDDYDALLVAEAPAMLEALRKALETLQKSGMACSDLHCAYCARASEIHAILARINGEV